MIAALSPADINFEETLSTLRYADRAAPAAMELTSTKTPMLMLEPTPFAPLMKTWIEEYDFVFAKIDIEGSEYSVLPTLPCFSKQRGTRRPRSMLLSSASSASLSTTRPRS